MGGFLKLPSQELKKKNTVCVKIMIGNLAEDQTTNMSEIVNEEPIIEKPSEKLKRLQTALAGSEQRGLLTLPRLKDNNAQFLLDVSNVRKKYNV